MDRSTHRETDAVALAQALAYGLADAPDMLSPPLNTQAHHAAPSIIPARLLGKRLLLAA
jgi:hypothetical protein